MKMKNQVLLLTLLVSGFVFCSHPRGIAQNDGQPDPQRDAIALAKADGAAPSADAGADEVATEGKNSKRRSGRHRNAVVEFGTTAELKAGDTAEAVVAILGSVISRGDVSDAVVAIAGSTRAVFRSWLRGLVRLCPQLLSIFVKPKTPVTSFIVPFKRLPRGN